MRSGRRPSPEGTRLPFAATISPRYLEVTDQLDKDDTTKPDGRQDEKKRKEQKKAETARKTKPAFLCPARGAR